MNDYQAFLASKHPRVEPAGFTVAPEAINPKLFTFQRDIVRWALQMGRAALFEAVGLGKTAQQLEWARHVAVHTGKPVLILAPLGVADQTVREGEKFGIEVRRAFEDVDCGDSPIVITNYDRVGKFDITRFGGVVLDESSILKHYSKTFFKFVELFADIPFRLCCTATPSPNDWVELGNHSMFLGIMHFKDMLARWFVGEGDIARHARLKHYAREDFWRWVTSWSVCISKPADLGAQYDMPGYDLPPLVVNEHRLSASAVTIERAWAKGQLLPDTSPSATEFVKVKRESLDQRIEKTVELVNAIWQNQIALCVKLAICGNQSTPSGAKKSTKPTLKNAKKGGLKVARRKKTGNTCTPITRQTRRSLRNTKRATLNSETLKGESGIKTTLNTAKNAARHQEAGISPLSETQDYAPNLVSPQQNTTASLLPKTDAALFAEPNLLTARDASSTSITTTTQGLCADCSAQIATWESGSSKTIPTCCCEQPNTSNNLSSLEPVVIWCDIDDEQRALERAFGDKAISVYGSLSSEKKEARVAAWLRRERPVLISKPSILGFGMNFQHCCHMIFAGVSFSFERTYQALGRMHRYGQTREVIADLVYAETEGNVLQMLNAKRKAFDEMQREMSAALKQHGLFRSEDKVKTFSKAGVGKTAGKGWTWYLGDCIEAMPQIETGSVDLTVTSIPFSNLYVYSDSEADVGNAADKDEFFAHMAFVIRELLRITRPGRCCAVHVKDLPLFSNRDGVMGVDPFSDDVTAAFRREGWIFQSRVTVEKDPVIEMRKTNSHGLLFKNWKQRAEVLRVGLPDYVLVFQKPSGEGEKPIAHDATDTTYYGDNAPAQYRWLTLPSRGTGEVNTALPVWQEYANPNWSDVVVPLVWTDINQTDVLNYLIARNDKDERHLCPLQLDLIARLIHWKSNAGDVIFDPFGGVASTLYQALKMGRRGVGVELKESYFNLGIKYLRQAEIETSQPTLFDFASVSEG